MALNKTLSFDLELKPGGIPPIIHASQGDIGRMFKANIYWDGSAATSYVSGATVNLRGKKPDKTVFDYTATLAGSMVTFETTEQMTIISGPVECELVFSNDGDIIASANFVLMVEDSPYNPDAPSESVVPGIEDLIEQTIGGDVSDEVDAWLDAHPEVTTTVQDGAITKAKINTAFLPEIENAYVTPEMYGAVGDGTTDDTEALNKCFASSKAVFLKSVYVVTGTVTFNSGTSVLGTKNSKVISKNNTRKPVFKGSEVSNVFFRNVTIEGNGQYDGLTDSRTDIECGIQFSESCSDIVVENCKITKCGQAAVFLDDTENVIVRDCYFSYLENPNGSFENSANHCFGIRTYTSVKKLLVENVEIFDVAIGIYLTHGGENIVVDNCYIHDISAQHAFYCATGDAIIKNCKIKNIFTNAISFQFDASSVMSEHTEVLNNTIENAQIGIVLNNIYNTETAFKNVIIFGNTLDNCAYGISYRYTENVFIRNNLIVNAIRTAIFLFGESLKSYIANNVIKNPGQGEVASYQYGIHMAFGTDITIRNNIILSDDEKMPYGIFAYQAATGLDISDNVIKGAKLFSSRFIDYAASLRRYSNNYADKVTTPLILNVEGMPDAIHSMQAAPATGYHARGEIAYNTEPTAGGNVGWVCITSGTPGVWKSFGVISS